MNKLLTMGSLSIAGVVASALVATQGPSALARGGDDIGPDDSASVVRVGDDRGRDHAEDGPHHGHHHRHHGGDDHGHHGGDDHGHHGGHGHDD